MDVSEEQERMFSSAAANITWKKNNFCPSFYAGCEEI